MLISIVIIAIIVSLSTARPHDKHEDGNYCNYQNTVVQTLYISVVDDSKIADIDLYDDNGEGVAIEYAHQATPPTHHHQHRQHPKLKLTLQERLDRLSSIPLRKTTDHHHHHEYREKVIW